MNKYLEHLVKDPLVYYVYQSDLSIYGIPSEEREYIVVVDKNYKVPEEFKKNTYFGHEQKSIDFNVKVENSNFIFFEMQEWFSKVLNCEVIVWQCACLDKKFIIKEYVKLTLEVNPLKLRNNFTTKFDSYISDFSNFFKGDLFECKLRLFQILKNAEFSNQIIDNHKIVNLKNVKYYYEELMSVENDENSILEKFSELQNKTIKLFMKKTEVTYKNSKLKKIIQNV